MASPVAASCSSRSAAKRRASFGTRRGSSARRSPGDPTGAPSPCATGPGATRRHHLARCRRRRPGRPLLPCLARRRLVSPRPRPASLDLDRRTAARGGPALAGLVPKPSEGERVGVSALAGGQDELLVAVSTVSPTRFLPAAAAIALVSDRGRGVRRRSASEDVPGRPRDRAGRRGDLVLRRAPRPGSGPPRRGRGVVLPGGERPLDTPGRRAGDSWPQPRMPASSCSSGRPAASSPSSRSRPATTWTLKP